jgi:hypothetical protein
MSAASTHRKDASCGACATTTGWSSTTSPQPISQAATFVGVCEGFLGIPVNWDLWVHLFRVEMHTLSTGETRVRRAVCAGGLMFVLRDSRKELYPPCMMTSNNTEWKKGWFYVCNDDAGLPPTPARC